jgi:hypothetical protein
MTAKQTQVWLRIQKIDAKATKREVEEWLIVTYTPNWEKGRSVGGVFRANPNPTPITFAVDVSGHQHGWGFTGMTRPMPKLPEGVELTTAEDMKPVLAARAESRKPVAEEEPKAEVEARPKATPKKRTPRTGVKVSANS